MKAAVLGTGAWGTALAQVLADNGWDVCCWGIVEKQVQDIRDLHTNSTYFEHLSLPRNLTATDDLKEAIENASVIVVAVPSFAVRSTIEKAGPFLMKGALPVSVAKGFDPQTGGFMSQVIRQCLPRESGCMDVVTLAGPSFAVEVAQRLATAIVAASPTLASAKRCQECFSNSYFRVYTNDDEIGAELCGAVKNVIALAAGCLDGMGFKINTRSALITRGLLEMDKIVVASGGQTSTVYGLTGLGDLVLTCSSSTSRNYQLGYRIGQVGSKQALAENRNTVEGVKACELLIERARKLGVDLPICESIYHVIYEGEDPRLVVSSLMNRPLKSEEDEE